jgi:NAD(P)-dependent dehydrogenase (short-subunit alcohol dehydrogenase family)
MGMELGQGKVAVVTGAASGIGRALCTRFAAEGMAVAMADVEQGALDVAAAEVGRGDVETLAVRVDVSKPDDLLSLAGQVIDRFGKVDVVCNNAGVAGRADPWFGPLSAWEWVVGVNFWGVVHGIRAFLPHLVTNGGHIVNTASIAGLYPGFTPAYDASKHAVVAISEGLYTMARSVGLPVGVSCLCPGWVRTGIIDSDRNWPAELGDKPEPAPLGAIAEQHARRAVDEGVTPAAVADMVASAVEEDRFWVFTQDEFVELCRDRWESIAARENPEPPEQIPGMPPRSQMIAEMLGALGLEALPGSQPQAQAEL